MLTEEWPSGDNAGRRGQRAKEGYSSEISRVDEGCGLAMQIFTASGVVVMKVIFRFLKLRME